MKDCNNPIYQRIRVHMAWTAQYERTGRAKEASELAMEDVLALSRRELRDAYRDLKTK